MITKSNILSYCIFEKKIYNFVVFEEKYGNNRFDIDIKNELTDVSNSASLLCIYRCKI